MHGRPGSGVRNWKSFRFEQKKHPGISNAGVFEFLEGTVFSGVAEKKQVNRNAVFRAVRPEDGVFIEMQKGLLGGYR